MNKKRILNVIYGFGYGGIRAFIMNSLEHIDKSKFQIDIYAFGVNASPFTEKVKEFGANIYFEPENNVRKISRFVNQLETFMKEHGPYDVVHAHCNLISAWVLLAAKRAGVPIRLAHSHTANHFAGGIKQKVYSYLRRFIISRLATEKLACGQLAGETMYGKYACFFIINNGIDVDRFIYSQPQKILELRKQLNIPEGVKVYANVTRMTPEKNHLFAIEIFKEIHKIEPNSVFIYGGVITSTQSTEEDVNAKIEEYGLKDHVHLLGYDTNPYKYVSKMDVFICASYNEGYSTAVTESIVVGTPVITTDCPGMSEILGDSGAGIIVENSYEGLRDITEALLTGKIDIQSLKLNAIKRAKHFERSNITEFEDVIYGN